MSDKIKILVCTDGKKCSKRGSDEVCTAIQEAVTRLDCGDMIKIKETKCLGCCKKGPAVLVKPGKQEHLKMTPEDGVRLVEKLSKEAKK